MRKTMLSLLLAAGAAMPAMAHAEGRAFQDRPDAPHQQGERPHDGGQGGGYHNGGGRPQQAPAPAPQPHPQPQPQPQPQVHPQANAQFGGHYDGQRGGWNRPDGYRPQGGVPPFAPGSGGYRPQPDQPGYQGRPPVAPGSGGYRPQPGQPGYQGGYRPQPGQPGYRGGQPGAPGGGGYRPQPSQPAFGGGYRPGPGGGSWNRTWRDDRHFDWHSYRVENRYIFNLPRYYAPSGWGYGYRRFAPGFTLSAVLYAQDYWINDPFYYRLPPAYGPYRWVRYYNDALLIDLRTGYVVDTVYDIFW